MERIYIIIYICTIPVSYILHSFCNFMILLAPGGPLTLYKKNPLLFFSISFVSSYNFLSSCLSVLVISWLNVIWLNLLSSPFSLWAFFSIAILKSGLSLDTSNGLVAISPSNLPSLTSLLILNSSIFTSYNIKSYSFLSSVACELLSFIPCTIELFFLVFLSFISVVTDVTVVGSSCTIICLVSGSTIVFSISLITILLTSF